MTSIGSAQDELVARTDDDGAAGHMHHDPADLSFHDTIRRRRSVRAFRPDPVPEALIRSVLEDAQQAPSNCNTQPWQVHIVSGQTRDRISEVILADWDAGRLEPDFWWDSSAYPGVYGRRRDAQGAAYYQALGIAREARAERRAIARSNLSFFGAPCAAFLFMPKLGDNVRVASDVGMYAQTFLLALTAHGLAGVPQTMLGYFGNTLRRELNIAEDSKLLFGISFGYPDETSAASKYVIGRDPFDDNVTFHR